MGYKEAFPDYDGTLPTIEGFEDISWSQCACPMLYSESLGLNLNIDYVDPNLSEFPSWRASGTGRYILWFRMDDHFKEHFDLVSSDDLDVILKEIEGYRAAVETGADFTPTSAPFLKPEELEILKEGIAICRDKRNPSTEHASPTP